MIKQPKFLAVTGQEFLVVQIYFSNVDGHISLIVTDEPFHREKDSFNVVWEPAEDEYFVCVTNKNWKGKLIYD